MLWVPVNIKRREHERQHGFRAQRRGGERGTAGGEQERDRGNGHELGEVAPTDHVADEVRTRDEHDPRNLGAPAPQSELARQPAHPPAREAEAAEEEQLVREHRSIAEHDREVAPDRVDPRSHEREHGVEHAERLGRQEQAGMAGRVDVELLLADRPQVKGPVGAEAARRERHRRHQEGDHDGRNPRRALPEPVEPAPHHRSVHDPSSVGTPGD
jgi:hypothetical protein